MKIFLTLDYELFSGPNPGTPQRCIIYPMSELDKVAGKYGVNYTVFVDAAYLLRLKQLSNHVPQLEQDFDMISSNIRKLVSRGHDIQMHFHPQWIYTTWNDKQGSWDMDITHFKLSDMDPVIAVESFAESKKILDSIVGYSTDCFRACGYCLESYRNYVELFKNNNIIKDSSVLRKCYIESPVHKYDYRDIPFEQVYRFSSSVCRRDLKGEFVELSISTFRIDPVSYLFMSRKAQKQYKAGLSYKDGKALPDGHFSKFSRLLKCFMPKTIIASLDGVSSEYLPLYLKKAEAQGQDELIICGHPKNASEGSINNLNKFLSTTFNSHTFLTSRDIQP